MQRCFRWLLVIVVGHTFAPQARAEEAWRRVVLPASDVSVEMPGTPQAIETELDGERFTVLQYRDADAGTAYKLRRVTFPPTTTPEEREAERDRLRLQQGSSSLVSRIGLTYGDVPADDVVLRMTSAGRTSVYRMHVFVVDGSLYELAAKAPEVLLRARPDLMERFFASVRVGTARGRPLRTLAEVLPAEPVPPAPSAAARPLPGKWEWSPVGGELPGPLYAGANLVAAKGDTLIIQNEVWGAGDTPTLTTYASAGCGDGAWTLIEPTPDQTTALAASREARRRGEELAKDPRFGGKETWFHWDGTNVYGVQGETLYASFDGGASWVAAQTIGLEPVPRFGQLVGCGNGLMFVPEVPAVWRSMKPAPP